MDNLQFRETQSEEEIQEREARWRNTSSENERNMLLCSQLPSCSGASPELCLSVSDFCLSELLFGETGEMERGEIERQTKWQNRRDGETEINSERQKARGSDRALGKHRNMK